MQQSMADNRHGCCAPVSIARVNPEFSLSLFESVLQAHAHDQNAITES